VPRSPPGWASRPLPPPPRADAGKQIYFGVFTSDAELKDAAGNKLSLEEYRVRTAGERARLQEAAACELSNIGSAERERRRVAGLALTALTAAVAAAMVAGGADGPTRLGVFPLVFFAFGYTRSAQLGLCNIGNGGLWDVDGTGLTEIEDASLASRIRDRVNDMNVRGLLTSAAITAAFAALPLPGA